ncbi:MAG: hypothetical protein R2771_12250 [Saprospiraceae bacterium]
MEIEKGKTYKYLRETHEVPQEVKDKLKEFNRIKKDILGELNSGPKTIEELAEVAKLPKYDMVFYLMSLLKYGLVEKDEIDDMDEYFTYKLKNNG